MGSPITVRAIGIVKDYEVESVPDVAEIARNVKWLNTEPFPVDNPKDSDKNNVRSNAVYEEFNPAVIECIIEKL